MNTTGIQNTAVGASALAANTDGSRNTAMGYNALTLNDGYYNTADGNDALPSNTSGIDNTGVGFQALNSSASGSGNAAFGYQAGQTNISGNNNTFLGGGADAAGSNLNYATAIGSGAVVSESNALILGGTYSAAVRVGIGTSLPADMLDISNVTVNGTAFAPNMIVGQLDGTNVFRISNSGTGYFDGGTQTGGADFAESVARRKWARWCRK